MAAPRWPTLSGQRQALDDYVAAMLQVPGKKGRYTRSGTGEYCFHAPHLLQLACPASQAFLPFQCAQPTGMSHRACPRLAGVREELRAGKYTLVLEFENAKAEALPQAAWDERVDVFATFFGPGVVAEMAATPAGQDVALIADGSGAGRGGGERPEVLPPLMPGLPGRQAKQAE